MDAKYTFDPPEKLAQNILATASWKKIDAKEIFVLAEDGVEAILPPFDRNLPVARVDNDDLNRSMMEKALGFSRSDTYYAMEELTETPTLIVVGSDALNRLAGIYRGLADDEPWLQEAATRFMARSVPEWEHLEDCRKRLLRQADTLESIAAGKPTPTVDEVIMLKRAPQEPAPASA
jgi:hypothetical protein